MASCGIPSACSSWKFCHQHKHVTASTTTSLTTHSLAPAAGDDAAVGRPRSRHRLPPSALAAAACSAQGTPGILRHSPSPGTRPANTAPSAHEAAAPPARRMSRGGRGGRGGGRGGLSSAARLNSGAVPFDIDEELEREFAKQKEDSDSFFPVSCPPIAAQPSRCTSPHPTTTTAPTTCAATAQSFLPS